MSPPEHRHPTATVEGASRAGAADAPRVGTSHDAVGVPPSAPTSDPSGSPSPAAATPDHAADKARYWPVVASHVVVDIYPIFFAALVLKFTEHLSLTGGQIATIYAVSAVVSGIPQAFFAWATDRFDTRLCAPAGLILSAVCSSLMGTAQNYTQLLALVAVAQVGNGMYHPVGAALAGQLGGRFLRGGRAMAVSIFFAAGMVGTVLGPVLCVWISTRFGLASLAWLIIPGVITALGLHAMVGRVGHRHADHRRHAEIPRKEAAARWATVWVLFAGNVLRFIVNNCFFVLLPIWCRARFAAVDADATRAATAMNRDLIIAMSIGMGLAAIFTSRIVPQGRERGAIVLLSVLGAVFTGLTGFVGTAWGLWPMYFCVAFSSLGYAAVLPMSIALAQRLLPGRTGLASGLMMGTAWSSAVFCPALAALFMGGADLSTAALTLDKATIDTAFAWFASMLLVSGGLAMLMPGWLIRKVAAHH